MRTEAARRRIAEAAVVLGMFGSFTKLQGGVAMADAHAAASCIGFEASEISPHGSSDEFPGGVPEVNRLLRDLGLPHGAIFSAVAKLHEGSHEACDEATE